MIRFCDILISICLLLLLSPLFLILFIAIYIESKGGVFYMQPRVGKNNKDFKLFKLRSMVVEAERNGLLTIGDKDSRITKVGYFIRKYKLDEFAQLINVIKGEMSIVGPRPEVRKYVDMYSKEQMIVLSVKPGITDYASIEFFDENIILGESDNPEKTYIEEIMPLKIELNKKYIKDINILSYFKIIILTIIKILK